MSVAQEEHHTLSTKAALGPFAFLSYKGRSKMQSVQNLNS